MNDAELKKVLHNGWTVDFNNQSAHDDGRYPDLHEGFTFRANHDRYVIFFNGACIDSVKTFEAFRKRLKNLMDKYHLEFYDPFE